MRRPRKLTPDAIERVIGALQAGADLALAAHLVGCSREALRLHGKAHPDVQERFDDACARADAVIVDSLYKAAKGGDTRAMIFWLKNRRPDEWRDRHDFTFAAKVAAENVANDLGIPVQELMDEAMSIARGAAN